MSRESSSHGMAPSWLTALPSHPIFTLPDTTSNATYEPSTSLSELARTSSPALSGIYPPSSAFRSRSQVYEEGATAPVGGRRKSKMVLVRGTEVILAVGKELRMMGLGEMKTRTERGDGEGAEREGEYKVLDAPAITFEIQQLVLNPSSKLLAVVGLHSVVVIVLPRKGWSNSVGRHLACRTIVVGKYYHSLPGSPAVAQVLWHPWGTQSSSLLILTSDALLREYTLSEDVEEPSQTVSFLPPSNGSKGKRGFSSDDVGAETAVAFCVGEGKSDWGPLTVWGLMRNGDVRAISPFLPRKATIPPTYAHSLATFVSTQSNLPVVSSPADPFQPFSSTRSMASTTTSHRESTSNTLRSTLQLQYVNALIKQVSSSLPYASTDDLDTSQSVDITLPSTLTRNIPVPQGPFLLQPAPVELENDAESFACDICYVNYSSTSLGGVTEEGGLDDGLGVVLVAFSDGKVDLCLVVEKVEAKWGEVSSIDDELESGAGWPSLAVYETIDLGLASALEVAGRDVGDGLDQNYPTFVKDSLYGDTVYIYHSLGAHCLLLSTWLDALADLASPVTDDEEGSDDEGLQKEVERTLRGQEATSVLWILQTLSTRSDRLPPFVVGVSIVNDIYLGYSLLLLTNELQLVAIELSLRVDSSLLPSDAADNSIFVPPNRGINTTTDEEPAYVSLLETPFTIPALLQKRSTIHATVPRLAVAASSSSSTSSKGKNELVINPDSLRYMGTTVEKFRHDIRDLVNAGDAVQCRLELQTKELGRQLGKLAQLSQLSTSLSQSGGEASGEEEGVKERLDRVTSQQSQLLERTDRLLQRLMDAHDPLVSNFERKWFDELGRLEKEVLGSKGGDRSLEKRAVRLEGQLDDLRPGLEEIKKKELLGKGVGGTQGSMDSPGRMGQSQMKSLEIKLAEESKLIAEARSKLERLTSALATSSLS